MTPYEAVLDWLGKHISWRYMLGVFVATGAPLFFAKQLHVYDWEHPYRPWLLVGFIFSAAVLLSYLCSGAQPWVSGHSRDWRMRRLGKEHLRHLSDDEKEHLRRFVETNGSSLHQNEANGALASLIEKNILFTPGKSWGRGLRDFRIRLWALEYLQEHPELLKAA